MADPTLAVLLRNGSHLNATIRYALKCNDVSISYARTPIQIPIPQANPELIDLGFIRPSLTCTGVIDTIGEDITNLGLNAGSSPNHAAGTAGMASFSYTRASVSLKTGSTAAKWDDGGDASAKMYYIPYKNALEEAVGSWLYLGTESPLQIEIGDSKFPIESYDGFLDPSVDDSRYGQSNPNYNIHATGGGIYGCAIQQGRFSLNAAREDRYDFTLQFVITRRLDIP